MKKVFTLIIILAMALVCFVSCNRVEQHPNEPIPGHDVSQIELPPDFSFSIVWGTRGISSYDSKSGKLIKTKDTDNIKKYTNYVKMSENELKLVYQYLCIDIDLFKYPSSYDPFNEPDSDTMVISFPSQTIIISVTANGQTHTVTCSDIANDSSSCCKSDEARAFMTA